jgi:hypothetical protein
MKLHALAPELPRAELDVQPRAPKPSLRIQAIAFTQKNSWTLINWLDGQPWQTPAHQPCD